MTLTASQVTLQINLAPGDVRHVRDILPHELRQFGAQVAEILLVIDLTRRALVDEQRWARDLDELRAVIVECSASWPHLRTLDVDASPELAQKVADAFFGGAAIPQMNWRGAPIYPYFFGLWAAEHDYVLHMDSDMLYGGGSSTWIREAVELLRERPDVLLCSPLPGPPRTDGRLASQTLAIEPLDSPAFRADHVSTRVFLIDRARFRERVGAVRVSRPSARERLLARLDGYAPYDCAETMLGNAMVSSGLTRIDFLGAAPGMWSVHPPYRSELFYEQLPHLIERIETDDVPDLQRGRHDLDDSMIDWRGVRRPRWWRLARHGKRAVQNLSSGGGRASLSARARLRWRLALVLIPLAAVLAAGTTMLEQANAVTVSWHTEQHPQTNWATCNRNADGSGPSTFTPLSDAAAAALVTPEPETRPDNDKPYSIDGVAYPAPNVYVPSDAQLAAFRSAKDVNGEPVLQLNPYLRYVDGRDGMRDPSTDDLIQWAAHKWGIPENWLRAEFVLESYWNQWMRGDLTSVSAAEYDKYPPQARVPGTLQVYQSLGITQVRWDPQGDYGAGTNPLRWLSTAFNLDEQAAMVRFFYDNPYGARKDWGDKSYVACQQWNSIGGWFSPYPWGNAGQAKYIANVKQNLADSEWKSSYFLSFAVPVPADVKLK